MAADLLTVYKRIIKRNTWLSPKTKKYALLKLENIKLEVGSPKILREDPILDYSSKEAYQNMRRMAYWRTKKMIALDGKASEVDIPIIDWEEGKMVGKQSYVVNAYYTPTENSIYVPLAYLQKPFIDLDERGIEYNLAHIGYTLGHEMSHCLDDLGSKYDEKGDLHNWWTKHDRNKFNSKVKNVIKQYEQFARYDGIKMDATLSTGENLADISGLAICEEYLRDFQDKNEDIVPIRALSFHAFFVYIAIQARQKIFDFYSSQLSDLSWLKCPVRRDYVEPFWHLYPVRVRSDLRERFMTFLKGAGIGVQVNYLPVYSHPVFSDMKIDKKLFPNSESFYSSEVSLPLHNNLTQEQLDFVVAKVKDFERVII
jgi:predicted metalloendopeptidase